MFACIDRKLLVVIAFSVCLVPGASAQAGTALTPAPISVAVLSGAASPVEIKTLPDAACTVQTSNASKTSGSLTLYADSDGVVRFHARPSSASITPLQLTLQCGKDGQTINHPIEVQVASPRENAVQIAPVVADLSPRATAGKVRPALTGDPLSFSPRELAQRGYPPRPDPQQAPGAYAAWLKMVSQPATYIAPHTVERPNQHNRPAAGGPSVGHNQAGIAIGGSSTHAGEPEFDLVIGEWSVPSVTCIPPGPNAQSCASSLWVGLDGVNAVNDLIQAGTHQDVILYSVVNPLNPTQIFYWEIASYYAWTEFFPAVEQPVANFAVGPGDDIYVAAWPSDAQMNMDPNASFAAFFIQNNTRNIYTSICTPRPGGMPSGWFFAGNSAEWVMERPVYPGGFLYPLSNFGIAHVFNAYAHHFNGAIVAYSDEPETFNFMDNGNTTLAIPWPYNATTISFLWLNFQ